MEDHRQDIRLIYEWNTVKNKIDYAISETELQLTSVNKRLQSLRHDLAAYIGLLIVPQLLFLLLDFLLNKQMEKITILIGSTFSYMILIPLTFLRELLGCVYILAFPFLVFHLVKTILLLRMNRESPDNAEYALPTEASKYHDAPEEREPTYRAEQQKLVCVLSRYYLYQDDLERIRKEIDAGSIQMPTLKYELSRFTLYEPVRPVNGFSSDMVQKARRTTFLILIPIAAIFILRILFHW